MKRTNVYLNSGNSVLYFGISYLLTDRDIEQFRPARQQLNEIFGDGILLAPEDTLHISIAHLVPYPYVYESREQALQHFEKQLASRIAKLNEIAATTQPFTVNFRTLEASKDAIVFRAYDNGQMANLRSKLATLCEPNAKTNDPEYIHSTQARYAQELDVDDVQTKIASIPLSVDIEISTLYLTQVNHAYIEPPVIHAGFTLSGR